MKKLEVGGINSPNTGLAGLVLESLILELLSVKSDQRRSVSMSAVPPKIEVSTLQSVIERFTAHERNASLDILVRRSDCEYRAKTVGPANLR